MFLVRQLSQGVKVFLHLVKQSLITWSYFPYNLFKKKMANFVFLEQVAQYQLVRIIGLPV